MKITEVRVSRCDHPKVKAYASITIDLCFVIRGFRVMSRRSGLYVAMPSRRKPDGSYEELVFPIGTEARAAFDATIMKAYYEDGPRYADCGVPAVMPTGPAPMQRGAAREIPPREAGRPDAISRRMPPPAPPFTPLL